MLRNHRPHVRPNRRRPVFAEGNVHEIRLDFSQLGYWDSLVANKPGETYMKCDVTVDGILYPDAGVRFKGNSSYNGPTMKKPSRLTLKNLWTTRRTTA
ncbi:MAG: hypothetical protein IPM82_03375 [Saprospiraceae bacterium]|nr:hypothetical protein [Saprospiraceae bacterium]